MTYFSFHPANEKILFLNSILVEGGDEDLKGEFQANCYDTDASAGAFLVTLKSHGTMNRLIKYEQ